MKTKAQFEIFVLDGLPEKKNGLPFPSIHQYTPNKRTFAAHLSPHKKITTMVYLFPSSVEGSTWLP